MSANDDMPLSPLSGIDQAFIALHEEFQSAMRAGFSHEQAFKLALTIWKARVEFGMMNSVEE